METTAETGIDIIAAERKRQLGVKGYTPEHDDDREAMTR
jgi:hypothetical protein